MRDCRLPLASLSVKPEYTWGSNVFIVDPIDDFIQDLGSRAIETLLNLIQPNSFRMFQEVEGSVLINMFDTVLDIWNREISKLLHQRLQLKVIVGNSGSCLVGNTFPKTIPYGKMREK